MLVPGTRALELPSLQGRHQGTKRFRALQDPKQGLYRDYRVYFEGYIGIMEKEMETTF